MELPLQITSELVRKLGPGLVSVAQCAVHSRVDAEDLVQEMWLGALASSNTFAGRSSVRTWLTAILRKRISQRFRRARTFLPLEEEQFSSGALDHVDELAARQLAEHALAMLPALSELQRTALTSCILEDLDRDEACDRLGITRGHLRVLLHRARRRLEEGAPI